MAESCRGASGIETKNFEVYCENLKTFCVQIPEEQVGLALDSQYIQFYSAGNAAQYYLWFNLTDGASVDPAPGGTGIQVDILSTDIPESISAAVAAAVDAEADFCAVVVPNIKRAFAIKTVDYLATLDPVSSDLALLDPFVEHEGFSMNLGPTQSGGFSIDTNVSTQEVVCDQTGSLPISETQTGISPEIEIEFKQVNTSNLRKLLAQGAGDSVTINGQEHFGLGTASIGRNTLTRSNRLTLHPVGVPASDRSQDWVFLLTFPNVSNINFPSDENCAMTVSFRALRDDLAKFEEVNVLFIGDARQV